MAILEAQLQITEFFIYLQKYQEIKRSTLRNRKK